jgi:circadian clock protein KaiC
MLMTGPKEEITLPRITTGSPELDEILGGGFPANSINIIMGEPGSGKTILAERMIFANASDDRPILYLTTLSEPLDKLVRYLQQFRFFDPDKLSGAIVYDSIGAELAARGVGALIPKLKDAIQEMRPKIIIVDSFKAIHDLASSVPEMRRMLYEMAGLLTAYDTTTFLIGEYSEHHIPIFPEFAVADAMIELARSKLSTRDERFLRVLKLRGSSYLEGLHGFRITLDGLEVYPRLVSPKIAPGYELLRRRIPTGVPGLDELLGGGFYAGRCTLVAGSSGTGKTTLGLQFAIEGLRRGEPCMYVNFEENPTQLASQLRDVGSDLDEACRNGLQLLYASPVELQIDSIVSQMSRFARQNGFGRIVVDAIGDLAIACEDAQRYHGYLYALVQHFAVHGVTALLTHESHVETVDARVSALCDNLLSLCVDFKNTARRTLRIVKARGLEHSLDPQTMHITAKGAWIE